MSLEKHIPIYEERSDTQGSPLDPNGSGCEKREPFALLVMGNSMEPEFNDQDVIVIEPDYPAEDDSYIIAWHDGEYIFRQLKIDAEGNYIIHPLNSHFPDQTLSGPGAIKGVISQKKSPGGRKNRKSYL